MAGENLNDLFDVVPEGEALETPEAVAEEVETEVETETASETVIEEKVDETPEEVVAETDPAPEADPTPDAPKSADEVSQLRILLREQNRRIRELQSKVEKSTGELKEKGYIEEPDEEEQLEAEKTNTLILPSEACIFNCPISSDSSLPSFLSLLFKSLQYFRGRSLCVSTSIVSITLKYQNSLSSSQRLRIFFDSNSCIFCMVFLFTYKKLEFLTVLYLSLSNLPSAVINSS